MSGRLEQRQSGNVATERQREANKRWREANVEHLKAYAAGRVEHDKQRKKRWRDDHAEYLKQIRKQYLVENAERVKESVKRYAEKNAARIAERKKAYNAASAERRKETYRRWREKNLDVLRERNRKRNLERKAKNPEQEAVKGRTRRARKKQAEGRHTGADVKALWLRQGKKCAVKDCQYPISDLAKHPDKYHVDHIIPLAPVSGPSGTNWPDNLQILCATHNTRKRNKDPYEWAKEIGRLFA